VLLGISIIVLFLLFFINDRVPTRSNSKLANNYLTDNEKVIYLTFDDGPITPITDKILDILKEKNVNATFFVIGQKVKIKEQLIKRIYNEGNGIGLHTYTHDYNKIYSSHKAFIDEMDKTSDEIYNVLGIRPKIIRFPTGSIGHLNKTLYKKLNEKNYKIYDWNARITDGIHPNKSPEAFYNEAVKTGKKWSTIFMLMHCDALNLNTCKALPRIIDYYKDNNYTFKVIDENTPEYFFRFEKKKSN
jgi:peptidoglycan-N-acetylglucosamine deacetylase